MILLRRANKSVLRSCFKNPTGRRAAAPAVGRRCLKPLLRLKAFSGPVPEGPSVEKLIINEPPFS
jgi:hypothetical protein